MEEQQKPSAGLILKGKTKGCKKHNRHKCDKTKQ